jgi:hypothetical protein
VGNMDVNHYKYAGNWVGKLSYGEIMIYLQSREPKEIGGNVH